MLQPPCPVQPEPLAPDSSQSVENVVEFLQIVVFCRGSRTSVAPSRRLLELPEVLGVQGAQGMCHNVFCYSWRCFLLLIAAPWLQEKKMQVCLRKQSSVPVFKIQDKQGKSSTDCSECLQTPFPSASLLFNTCRGC